MKVAVKKERTLHEVELLDEMDNIMLDLQADIYLLRLMEDYGELCNGFSDEVKKRAYDNVRSYQEHHVRECVIGWRQQE